MIEWARMMERLSIAGTLSEASWDSADTQLQAEVRQQIAMNLVQGYFYYFGSDPSFPDFAPFFNSVLRLQPNPDDVYYMARIDGAGRYRISGERGTVRILNFTSGHAFVGTTDKPGGQDAEVDADELSISDDGTFELIIGPDCPGANANWLMTTARSDYILVRMRSYDWGGERDPRLAIERLDGVLPRPRMVAKEIDERLDALMTYADRTSRQWYAYQQGLRDRGIVNQLELTRFEDLGGGNLQTYWQGAFQLHDGEVLLLETAIPETLRYWNVQVNDQLFNMHEFLTNQSSLNGHQATIDSDGKFRAIISAQDPSVPNWLDTVGRQEGTLIGRWYGASSTPLPSLTSMRITDVRHLLPADTPAISPQERTEQLRDRARGGQMRRRW